jgi:hypothetical protein
VALVFSSSPPAVLIQVPDFCIDRDPSVAFRLLWTSPSLYCFYILSVTRSFQHLGKQYDFDPPKQRD